MLCSDDFDSIRGKNWTTQTVALLEHKDDKSHGATETSNKYVL